MSDFKSSFWAFFIGAIVLLGVIFNLWMLIANGKVRAVSQDNTTGHIWDEDLREFNNPLPRWWVGLFVFMCLFGLIYFALYPGLGFYPGALGWTSHKQFREEMQQGNQEMAPVYAAFAGKTTEQLAQDPQAMKIGDSLFMNNCAQCHSSDAKGSAVGGFPDLTAKSWIWGGTPQAIHDTIVNGRTPVMPPQGTVLGTPDDVKNVANYVLGLAGQPNDAVRAAQGEAKFKTVCAACHGADGKGNPLLGAPNLAKGAKWYMRQPTLDGITAQINGGNGNDHGIVRFMPAWGNKFTPAQIDILTAYVWGKGGGVEPAAATPVPVAADGASAAAPAVSDAASQ
ncbi:MAG: cytochrome-c oxidase, cbb3-type subunit III [Burkholderiaceae bacterium]|jgi:cytochrome c oxidase cbb3-type subunit 3|nr:cytochrome-c oxidase, cbb3-type subunit III [Burkholderiaceae bacterium]